MSNKEFIDSLNSKLPSRVLSPEEFIILGSTFMNQVESLSEETVTQIVVKDSYKKLFAKEGDLTEGKLKVVLEFLPETLVKELNSTPVKYIKLGSKSTALHRRVKDDSITTVNHWTVSGGVEFIKKGSETYTINGSVSHSNAVNAENIDRVLVLGEPLFGVNSELITRKPKLNVIEDSAVSDRRLWGYKDTEQFNGCLLGLKTMSDKDQSTVLLHDYFHYLQRGHELLSIAINALHKFTNGRYFDFTIGEVLYFNQHGLTLNSTEEFFPEVSTKFWNTEEQVMDEELFLWCLGVWVFLALK